MAQPAVDDPVARCGLAGRREIHREWPKAAAAELASNRRRSGPVEVNGRVEQITPGYDCGGSQLTCGDRLRPVEVVVTGDDSTRLTLRSDTLAVASELLVGVRYSFSVVDCPSDGGPSRLEIRGYEPMGREHGAELACMSAAPLMTKVEAWPERPLASLARHLVLPGGFNTRGFVVERFVPAPCPPTARRCKPQFEPYVVIGERAAAPEHTLTVDTPAPSAVPLGVPVRVSVVLCGERKHGGSVNHGQLRALVRD